MAGLHQEVKIKCRRAGRQSREWGRDPPSAVKGEEPWAGLGSKGGELSVPQSWAECLSWVSVQTVIHLL